MEHKPRDARYAGVAELVDAAVLKTVAHEAYGFESRHRHETIHPTQKREVKASRLI